MIQAGGLSKTFGDAVVLHDITTKARKGAVVLIDEPASALAPTMVSEVSALIRTLAGDGMTVSIVTDEMDLASDGPAESIAHERERGRRQLTVTARSR